VRGGGGATGGWGVAVGGREGGAFVCVKGGSGGHAVVDIVADPWLQKETQLPPEAPADRSVSENAGNSGAAREKLLK